MLRLACPVHKVYLNEQHVCPNCGQRFMADKHGFLQMSMSEDHATSEELAETQETCGTRMYEEYLYYILRDCGANRVLDVGCGTGGGVSALVEKHGLDAYGIDLPFQTTFWRQYGRDPRRFFSADATKLPFANEEFDFVISTGVIEHIGTTAGGEELADGFEAARQKYVNELLRVTRPDGHVIIACPNKTFPVDLQHAPPQNSGSLRSAVYRKTGIHVHPTWGRYHLVSYSEIRDLLRPRRFEALPLRGYFGFAAFRRPALKPLLGLAQAYLNLMPGFLRATGLNPYMLVMVRK